MNWFKIGLFFLLFNGYMFTVTAQRTDLEKYNKEKENVLNVILNSRQFDSIYFSKKVYFKTNELLSLNSSLSLKKGDCKVLIKKESDLKGKSHVVLGDFTMPTKNPEHARVQLEVLPDYKMITISLKKAEGKWVIMGHRIFDE